MKKLKSHLVPEIVELLPQSSNAASVGNDRARLVLCQLLDEPGPVHHWLCEASLHKSKRGKVWIACFTRAEGGQRWRSTGLTDYDQAMNLARAWEKEERELRAKLGPRFLKRATRVRLRRNEVVPPSGPFTQEETARILGLSIRAVREIEHRALKKLRQHPALRSLWGDYTGELEEGAFALDSAETAALFDLCCTAEEFSLIEKILAVLA